MSLKVAVLDEEESLRRLISLIISQKGHTAMPSHEPDYCPVYTGEQAVCPRDQSCFDLVIIDSRPPKMHALQFIKKQIEGGCKGMVGNKLVLSTRLSGKEVSLAEELGCHISKKPFKIEEVLLWLDDCVAKVNRQKELPETLLSH